MPLVEEVPLTWRLVRVSVILDGEATAAAALTEPRDARFMSRDGISLDVGYWTVKMLCAARSPHDAG